MINESEDLVRLFIISEAPIMTTGFGVVCHHFATALQLRGLDVRCFGTGFTGWNDTSPRAYRVWLSGRAPTDFSTDIPLFLMSDDADCLLLVGDTGYVVDWFESIRPYRRVDVPIVAHIVADGLPVSRSRRRKLGEMDAIACATESLATELRTQGLDVSHVPYGVDHATFVPLSPAEKDRMRQELGLSDCILIGTFGRNDERKQHPRILKALQLLCDTYKDRDFRLYMHTNPVDDLNLRGWDLVEVAENLRVEHRVIFPHKFTQLTGISPISIQPNARPIDCLSYPSRMAICDVAVNAAFAGGFELTTLELQACGVPLVLTNDRGSMSEVAGNGAALVDGIFGVWENSAYQVLVDPEQIAQAIFNVTSVPEYRDQLIEAGNKNAGQYSWEKSGALLHGVLASARTSERNF